jgi:hypothetical protein
MSKSLSALSAMAALTLSSAVMAADLAIMQAGTFVLGDHVASVYYTARGEHYDVVTTIAPEQGRGGAPVRFVASLEAGESQTVSVGGFGATAPAHALRLAHGGDHLIVTTVDMQLAAR